MLSDRQSARILDLLYAAPGDLAGWTKFLREFSQSIDVASISFIDASPEHPVGPAIEVSPEAAHLYGKHYHDMDPFRLGLRVQGRWGAGDVFDGQAVCSPDELRSTEFYNDFMKRWDWSHICLSIVEIITPGVSPPALVAIRNSRQTDFSEQELGLVSSFVPHVRRAFKLQRCFAEVKRYSEYQKWTLDRVSFGVVLLRRDGTVLVANRAAERICNGDGLRLTVHGIYATGSGSDNHLLQALLKDAKRPSLTPAFRGTTIAHRRDGTPLVVTVGPVAAPQPHFGVDSSEWLIALFIHDPSDQPACSEDVLRKVYGLTPAECRLASLVADGVGVPNAADRLGITFETARTQLKSVFQKTLTNRQSQLARMLGNLSGVAL
jgi:DNA-binding CsgD family transcriptional regulator